MKKSLSLGVFLGIVVFIAFLYAVFPLPKPVKNDINQNSFVFKSAQNSKEQSLALSQEKEIEKETEPQKKELKPTKADKIIAYAKTKLKLPYKQAGTTDKGYDCSGLIMMSFKQEKFLLPRISYQMATKGKPVNKDQARKGDLIFFATNPKRPKKINHVGLVTEVKEGIIYFIHSSTKRGVIINNISEKYYKESFIKLRRVLKDE